jgi:hypothetical protein
MMLILSIWRLKGCLMPHAGIVFGQQHKHGIGDWVRYLELIHAVLEPDDLLNQIEYL